MTDPAVAPRADTRCDQCGQMDDHPKVHYGQETYHHDCMPYTVVRDYTTYGFWGRRLAMGEDGNPIWVRGDWVEGPEIPDDEIPVQIRRALRYRDMANNGVRGEELRAAVQRDEE